MISYSSLNLQYLKTILKDRYKKNCDSIVFLKRGFNDTYKITSGEEKYILRIYRTRRRTLEEIQTELNLLLNENRLPVSVPLPDKDNHFIQEIPSPEGQRVAVMFSFVEGESLRRPSVQQCRQAGEALGAIQNKLLSFESGPLTWDYSPDSIFSFIRKTVNETLKSFPDDLVYLDRLEGAIKNRLAGLNLKVGICHGDLQPENFYFQSNGAVSFIDFDFCGKGPLLYDLGAYTWYDHQGKTKEMLQSFQDGYSTYISLSKEERELIPLFGTLRALFLMGMWNRFMDGESNPVWPAAQVSDFVKKLKKWVEKECRMEI